MFLNRSSLLTARPGGARIKEEFLGGLGVTCIKLTGLFASLSALALALAFAFPLPPERLARRPPQRTVWPATPRDG